MTVYVKLGSCWFQTGVITMICYCTVGPACDSICKAGVLLASDWGYNNDLLLYCRTCL